MLHAELDVQQTHEVIDLCQRSDGRFAASARSALLDRNRWWNAVDRIDVGPACRLHDRSCVCIERFQIAALALIEKDVERQRGFARARDSGDDRERIAWNLNVDGLQIV